jgi:hypothetical protein
VALSVAGGMFMSSSSRSCITRISADLTFSSSSSCGYLSCSSLVSPGSPWSNGRLLELCFVKQTSGVSLESLVFGGLICKLMAFAEGKSIFHDNEVTLNITNSSIQLPRQSWQHAHAIRRLCCCSIPHFAARRPLSCNNPRPDFHSILPWH